MDTAMIIDVRNSMAGHWLRRKSGERVHSRANLTRENIGMQSPSQMMLKHLRCRSPNTVRASDAPEKLGNMGMPLGRIRDHQATNYFEAGNPATDRTHGSEEIYILSIEGSCLAPSRVPHLS